jgi:hypothetical protein
VATFLGVAKWLFVAVMVAMFIVAARLEMFNSALGLHVVLGEFVLGYAAREIHRLRY